MNEHFTDKEKDLLLIALILHDSFKLGFPKEEYTRFDHPLLAGKFIKENQDKTTFNDKEIKFLVNAIATHMGEWNKSSYSEIVLPKPKTKSINQKIKKGNHYNENHENHHFRRNLRTSAHHRRTR